MKRRAARLAAWAACGLTLALIAVAGVLAVLNDYDLGRASFLVAEALAAVVGAVISSRQPRNPVGWLILGHALCFTLGEFGRQYAIYGVRTAPGSLPAAEVAIWPTYWIWFPGLVLMFLLLPLYFPDGRLVSPHWRWVVWLSTAFLAVTTVVGMFRPGDEEAAGIPNPLGIGAGSIEPYFSSSGSLIPVALPFLGGAAAASLVVRFRRSSGIERQQIKWVVLAVVFVVLYTAIDRLFFAYIPPFVSELLFLVALGGIWIAIAVAILRYRLYDIDVIINRTLVYGALTATLALVYAGSVVLLQYVFRAVAGGESQLAIVASTLLIAGLFNPLRRKVQELVDRRFYRAKYDAARTLESFSARLRDETDLNALAEELVDVVGETVRPTHASLWLLPRESEE